MTSDLRPPSTDRSAQLVSVIRADIESNPDCRITFDRFMELALYEPNLGYYRQATDRPTDAGDFLTAPETHPIFGWTVARRIEAMWSSLDRPDPFWLIEFGAGSGTLALSILEGFRKHADAGDADANDLLAAVRYRPVEQNPYRLEDLRHRFEDAGLAGHLESSTDRLDDSKDRLSLPTSSSGSDGSTRPADFGEGLPVSGVLIANEFLDALPVHRLIVRGGELLELYVEWRDGLVEVPGPMSTPQLARRLESDGIVPDSLVEGQLLEACLGLDPWLGECTAAIARGHVLVIDYGAEAEELYDPRRHVAGTLLGYRAHRLVGDPFEGIGLTDLTAHVDFTALRLIGERHGFRAKPLATQSEWLVAAGLEAELQALQASPTLDAADYRRARSGIARMLDPRHMGRFRVLELEK